MLALLGRLGTRMLKVKEEPRIHMLAERKDAARGGGHVGIRVPSLPNGARARNQPLAFFSATSLANSLPDL